jgi:hypothetical protein
MNLNVPFGQLIKEHFLGSFQGVKVYILTAVKSVPKYENSINTTTVKSRKECVLIELFIVVQKMG